MAVNDYVDLSPTTQVGDLVSEAINGWGTRKGQQVIYVRPLTAKRLAVVKVKGRIQIPAGYVRVKPGKYARPGDRYNSYRHKWELSNIEGPVVVGKDWTTIYIRRSK